jgi:hypothetical protein
MAKGGQMCNWVVAAREEKAELVVLLGVEVFPVSSNSTVKG